MVVVDAVYLVVDVDSERHPVEALVAHAAPEASRVVGLAHGLQYLCATQHYVLFLNLN